MYELSKFLLKFLSLWLACVVVPISRAGPIQESEVMMAMVKELAQGESLDLADFQRLKTLSDQLAKGDKGPHIIDTDDINSLRAIFSAPPLQMSENGTDLLVKHQFAKLLLDKVRRRVGLLEWKEGDQDTIALHALLSLCAFWFKELDTLKEQNPLDKPMIFSVPISYFPGSENTPEVKAMIEEHAMSRQKSNLSIRYNNLRSRFRSILHKTSEILAKVPDSEATEKLFSTTSLSSLQIDQVISGQLSNENLPILKP